jgi:putative tryptophan/tyrosine transport system substrate-binding protein
MNAFPSKSRSDNPKSPIQNPKWLALSVLAFVLVMTGAVAQAQQPAKVPRIGIIRPSRSDSAGSQALIAAFRQGLRDLGYVEGQNITLEIRWADGNRDRLPQLADELVRLKVDVIVTGGNSATQAVKRASSTIPIVMTQVSEPVRDGFVESFARPGRNITGLTHMNTELAGKRLELLKDSVPKTSRVAVLWNPANPAQPFNFKEIETAAKALAVSIRSLPVRVPEDFDGAFEAAVKGRVDSIFVSSDGIINSHRKEVVNRIAKNRLPAMYTEPEWADTGGLMVYGPSNTDLYRRAATYVDKILKGIKPTELPIEQPTKFELIINLKAAQQIGLTIPPNVLARADKVIK